jgi:hypothetical protein
MHFPYHSCDLILFNHCTQPTKLILVPMDLRASSQLNCFFSLFHRWFCCY